ncbi:unnamed protein product [Macrosiphum euphorbiae]|nr:unnamed protein product [Macrosiphum euphorbiae]
MTTLYNQIRRNMKTSLSNLDVNSLQNSCMGYTDMSVASLCRVELGEFRGVCESWTKLLTSTLHNISTSSPSTTTTSTSATYVDTREGVVGAPSLFEHILARRRQT